MGYATKFMHDLRIGQTIYLVAAKRIKCPTCHGTTKWKYYVKATKITGIVYYKNNKKNIEIHYYCKQGRDEYMPISDTIFTNHKDAREECILKNKQEVR